MILAVQEVTCQTAIEACNQCSSHVFGSSVNLPFMPHSTRRCHSAVKETNNMCPVMMYRQLHLNELKLLRQQLQGKEAEVTRLHNEASNSCCKAEQEHTHKLIMLETMHKEVQQQMREQYAAEVAEIHRKHEQQVTLTLSIPDLPTPQHLLGLMSVP